MVTDRKIPQLLTRTIDALYLPPFRSILSPTMFRYGVCGALNMMLDSVWYFLIYHFIVQARMIPLGFVTVSPHIASLIVVFPITFLTGFWLNRSVAFVATASPAQRQIVRYALTVVGSLLLNYVCMKLLVEWVGLWPTPSKMVTTLISVAYSYTVGRYYTFQK